MNNDAQLAEATEKKRATNEKKFYRWKELPDGGRKYWYDVIEKSGYKARYVKEVDKKEETTKFYQEIYDKNSNLIEIHQKFPVDLDHQPLRRKK